MPCGSFPGWFDTRRTLQHSLAGYFPKPRAHADERGDFSDKSKGNGSAGAAGRLVARLRVSGVLKDHEGVATEILEWGETLERT